MVRSRLTCTTNSWREKLGLPRKGKPLGGKIPITLQKELDMLMMEMSMGSSSVSVRKEMVTAEAVVASSVVSWDKIIQMSVDAWQNLAKSVFESSWVVTGYFEPEHFQQFHGTAAVPTAQAAKTVLDPTGLLAGGSTTLSPTPQFCTQFEWQLQDESGDGWNALPYEIAHGVVRTLAEHAYNFRLAKNDYKAILEGDPGATSVKAKKQKEILSKLERTDRFLVFNRRTGELATTEWVKKYLTANPATGKPQMKNEKSTAKPWVMTLRIVINQALVEVSLRPYEAADFRAVRCYDIQNGLPQKQLTTITQGYQHLHLRPGDDGEESEQETWTLWAGVDFSNDDDGESLPGDEQGLEGRTMVQGEPDPAPAPKAGCDKEPTLPGERYRPEPNHSAEPGIPPLEECSFMVCHDDGKSSPAEEPAEFRSRPSYVLLRDEGLTELPPVKGAGIYYHNSTSQWHAIFGCASEKHRAPTHGENIRSERKAILLALIAMWEWYCTTTENKTHHKYLAVLSKALSETPF
ncbi:unnamed protein product [Durusdinium trenchii]|uniref:Uncharacterized protein n=1 Tax=Durusdinium trenchii TaxID=1381693 RepID=A0ABP0H6K6_9DINO